jgi:hypothetical protein
LNKDTKAATTTLTTTITLATTITKNTLKFAKLLPISSKETSR